MKLPVRWLVLGLCGLLVTAVPGRAFLHVVKDGPHLRPKLAAECRQLFLAEKFGELEQRADRMRREPTRLPEGIWELGLLYAGIGSGPEKERPDRAEQLARIQRWQKAFPASITARIAQAHVLVAHAWDARGKTYANAVTDDGRPVITDDAWRLFAERLAAARKVLEADPALRQCPGYYSTMINIAKGEGWQRDATERLYRAGIALAPDFEMLHFNYSDYLQPKWHGRSAEEWLRTAERVADEFGDRGGRGVYARLVWHRLPPTRIKEANFAQSGIDWSRLKAGFEDLEKVAAGSAWNKNAYCYYACAAGDKATARRLFAELDDNYAKEIWRTREAYKKARDWAE